MVLLIHDDARVVGRLKHLLLRAGREVQLASSVAQAIEWLTVRPELIVLAPHVDSGRGHVVLEERVTHPQSRTSPVLLLEATAPGFDHPVVNEPFEETFLPWVDRLAPLPAVALLQGAEQAMAKARADATTRASAALASESELARQVKQLREAMEDAKANERSVATQRDEVQTQLQALQAEHEQTQTALAALSRDHSEALSRRDALRAKLDAELERGQSRSQAAAAAKTKLREVQEAAAQSAASLETERAARSAADAELLALREQIASLESQASAQRAEHERGGHEHQEALKAVAAKSELELARAKRQLETAREAHRIELSALTSRLEEEALELEGQLDATRAQAQSELQAALSKHQEETARLRTDLESRLTDATDAHRRELESVAQRLATSQLEQQRAKLAHAEAVATATQSFKDELAQRDAQAQTVLLAHQAEMASLQAAHQQGRDADAIAHQNALERAEADREEARAAARTAQEEARLAQEAWASEVSASRTVRTQLEQLTLEKQRVDRALLEARASALAEQQRADAAELRERNATERILALESRTHVLATIEPSQPPLAIPRDGTVAVGELARLLMRLWEARVDVRVDLAAGHAFRRLWLRRGALVAAHSSVPQESLIGRARRDGLIDAKQQAELAEIRDAGTATLLEEMRQRRFLRRSEVDGLAQRHCEEVALEAMSEAVCTYRLVDEEPGSTVAVVEARRALPSLVAQALKRALSWEAQLQILGGSQSVLARRGHPAELEALGLSDKEVALIDSCDGRTSIETQVASSGLRPERAYQALTVAKILGLIAVEARDSDREEAQPGPDTLDAKFDQVHQVDYFAILELPRTASAAEVREAHARLAQRFDPLKWSTHPDGSLLRRAQQVYASIAEAARTLSDDRLRAEYARNLID